jgi:hypothetical protein
VVLLHDRAKEIDGVDWFRPCSVEKHSDDENPDFAPVLILSLPSQPVVKEQLLSSVNHQFVGHSECISTMGLTGLVAELVVLGCYAAAGK